ncbi:lactate permease [Acetoanaerobium pronyense]|uniref:L-lactate permease n=1 Tax=Acetoanaerobium pronyense TaxID=1482736 RepID=A0ABS4KG32_9FIRM|nr:lactate permease [Acetoanaerobium pronyense]
MELPVNIFYWILAIFPILLLLILMIGFHFGASRAAPITLLVTFLSSMLFFKANLGLIYVELSKALWNSLSIILIIFSAILLYEVSNESKSFSVLNKAFKALAPNELLRILLIGVVFASFLQGVTGFGVPVLVTAPLLIGIGVAPVWAVVIPLIGHSWAGTFGTLAIAWNSMIMQVEIQNPESIALIALYTSFLLFLLNMTASFAISFFYGGFKGLKKGFLGIILISLCQGGGQVLLSQVNPDLAVFIPSSISMLLIALLSKTRFYSSEWQIDESKIMIRDKSSSSVQNDSLSVNDAFMPYYMMTGITLFVLLISPINDFLGGFSYGPSYAQTSTGFGIVNKEVLKYSPIKPFTHASMFLFSSAFLGYIYYFRKGIIEKKSYTKIISRTIKKTIPSSMAVISLISMSRIMSGNGQTEVLAQGVSLVLGENYVLLSPFIGLLGSFMTGSNMSSNILFGNFQMATAQITGLDYHSILGAQTAGGSIGTSIAPGNIVLGTTTASILGSEGKVLRKIMPFALTLAFIFGIILYFLN